MMIGQRTSLSFVQVKNEPSSPELAAKRGDGSSIVVGTNSVPFDHDYFPSQSTFSYPSLSGNQTSFPTLLTVAPDIKPLFRADTSQANLSDSTSNYSPVSTYSAAPIETELPSGADANLSETRGNVVIATPPNPTSAACDHYEYPRYYFEALIDDAQIRYDKASEFFANMRSYSSKCDVYVTILQDLFVELAKPPPTLKPELYKRLARLRRSIRHLELKMAARRPRAASHSTLSVRAPTPTPSTVVDLCERSASVPAPVNAATNLDVTSSVQEPEPNNNVQEYCLKQMKMKEILEQKIYDLAIKERELRQERLEAEAELNYLFGGGANSSLTFDGRPKYNCVFCGKHNQSHTCWTVPTLEERRAFFQMYKICFTCGKQHYGDCHLSKIVVCLWPQCGAKGEHNSIFCPKIAYPITKAQVLALRASQNMPTTFVCPPETRKEVLVSSGMPVSHPPPAQSPLSRSLSVSQPEVGEPIKRPKKRVTVTVLKEPPTKKQCC